MRATKKILRKRNFDEVVFEGSFLPMEALKNKKILRKYKGHCWFHAHLEAGSLNRIKKPFENLEGVIGISNYICRAFEKRNDCRIPKTYLLYNFVDNELFYPREKSKDLQAKYGLNDDDFVVVFAGRLSEEKGIGKLVKAFKEVVKEESKSKLLIVGSGLYKENLGFLSPFLSELNEMTEEIKDNVVFTGYVAHSDIPDIYALADTVCLPSTWQEPAGLTVIEAMSCGKALITTESGGIPEYVGDAGIVLPLDDELVKNIASSILKLERDAAKRKELGLAARKRSLEFGVKRFYEGFKKIVVDHEQEYTEID